MSVCNGMSIALNLRNCVMSCCAVIAFPSLFGIQYVRLIATYVTHYSTFLNISTPCPHASSPTVVLYNCGDLSGNDCSGCLGLSADYRCGYCQPNCIMNSLTCESSVIQAPNFQQCGAITVAGVSEFISTIYPLSPLFGIRNSLSSL